jgi:hypothetical protein
MSIEERKRLFFLLLDRQTLQLQHNEGIPVDVPEPRNRIFIIKSLICLDLLKKLA